VVEQVKVELVELAVAETVLTLVQVLLEQQTGVVAVVVLHRVELVAQVAQELLS
jgi:hypothetical protein